MFASLEKIMGSSAEKLGNNKVLIAIRDGLEEAQKVAAEKMQPLMGGLGNLGL